MLHLPSITDAESEQVPTCSRPDDVRVTQLLDVQSPNCPLPHARPEAPGTGGSSKTDCSSSSGHPSGWDATINSKTALWTDCTSSTAAPGQAAQPAGGSLSSLSGSPFGSWPG